MKNFKMSLFIVAILLGSINSYSQTAKSQHKVYIPLWIGAGYGYELKVADQFTISAQADYRAYIGDDNFAVDNFVFSPRVTIEPRYYYNLKKRAEKGKNINSNSANYFSLDMSYELPVGLSGMRDFPQQTFRILPTWGIRRELSEHFTMDFGIYVGFKAKEYGDRNPETDRWDSEPWTSGKIEYGVNLIFSHIF